MEWLPDAPGSGVARMFHGLTTHLPEQGVDVTGLVTGNGPMKNESGLIHGFAPPSTALPTRLWMLRSAMKKVMHEIQPDLIAVHFALYALPSFTIPHDCPLLMHFHGPWALESKAEGANVLSAEAKAWIERIVYGGAQRFIVLSEAFKSILTTEYGVDRNIVRIVPGGVDVDRFDAPYSAREAREQLEWPLDGPIIFSVRRLVRRVGLKNLILAMQQVTRHVPDVRLLIAGKGPLASKLEVQIDQLNLSNQVKLLGFVPDDDLPLAYRAADISIVPTQSLEGFGLVAVESLAAGTPVLVTPVGGLPEVVHDLSTDLIMHDTTAKAIGEHITAALDGSVTLPSAETCREYATSRYDWSVIAQQVRDVYEEVL